MRLTREFIPPTFIVAKKIKQREDRQYLYLASVQCPEADISFFKKVYKKHFDRPLRYLREDFCGTASLCAEWVRDHPENRALGIDYDQPTLTWGEENVLNFLDENQRNRIELQCDDVRNVSNSEAELLCAQNFSYWIFQEREEMKRYLSVARDSLADEGLLVLDLLGGTESTEVDTQERKISDGIRPDGTVIPTFTYIWDQNTFNPITAEMQCYIHFRFQGRKMNKAFSYKWRMWTLPELRDIIMELGFSDFEVYTEGWDDETEESDGIFRKRKDFDHEGSYIAYLVCKK